jgi:hypothetical protein
MKKIIFLLLFFPTLCFGGIVLDGSVGYSFPYKMELKDYQDLEYRGGLLDARAGISILRVLLLGGEFTYVTGNFKYSYSNSEEKVKAPRMDYGVFLGLDLPVNLRFWVSYLKSEINFEDGVSSQIQGQGKGLGLGWTVLPFISINGEYRKMEYDQSSGGRFSLSDQNKLNAEWISLSIGFYTNLF